MRQTLVGMAESSDGKRYLTQVVSCSGLKMEGLSIEKRADTMPTLIASGKMHRTPVGRAKRLLASAYFAHAFLHGIVHGLVLLNQLQRR
jgi:hypothetical protein